jgi:hypothetical protein
MGCSLLALIDVGTKVTMQNVPHPLPLPPSGAISELILNDMISSTTLAESDDDDLAESDDDDEYDDDNNDDDNYNYNSTDDNTYSYDYDNTVSAAQKQKANNNELIATACPTCPRKKDKVLAVDNKIHNDNSNTYIHDNYIRNNTNADEDFLFVVPSITNSLGRGGSFTGRQFVFALLDWQNKSLSARKFYVTHADDMGIGPVQPRNAQQLLNSFFSNHPNGDQWRKQYNLFVQSQNQENH